MCRSHSEGYRRCNSDSSALRQERRIVAKITTELASSVHAPIKSVSNHTNSDGFKSIKEIRKDIASLKSLIEGFTYLNANDAKVIKDRIIKIGSDISLIAANNLGIKEDEIFAIEKREATQLQKEYEASKALYSNKSLELSKKYNIMNMDVPYTLSLMLDSVATPNSLELKNDYNNIKQHKEKVDILYDELRSAKIQGSKTAKSLRDKLRLEHIKLISELRDLGGDIKTHPNSNQSQLTILAEASSIFPKEWIQASNIDGENLLIKKTRARAHYTESATQKTYKLFESGYIKAIESNKIPDGTRWESGWIELKANSSGEAIYTDASGVEHSYYLKDGEKAYYVPNWEYYSPYYNSFDSSKGKPKGNGWESVTIKELSWNRETNEKTYVDTVTWRRVKKERRAVGFSSTAELLIDDSKDTAMHEFMHRIEARKPILGKIQEAFIKDRTTDESGAREPFIKLYGRSKEVSRPDNFVSDYMGKHYSDSKHWEVLSTGAEAVFGDAYGGLIGISDFKKDLEHRDFVLGVFAAL